MPTLIEIYDRKLGEGSLHADADQKRAVEALEKLRQKLVESGFRRMLGESPRGFYFYGGVGRGKSMVMDMFFESVDLTKKRRVHFHAFMLEVHDFLHAARSERAAN